MDKAYSEISAAMIERYSNRYKQLGFDIKTLGWGNKEQQVYRFAQTLTALPTEGDFSLLDIGCGFGDYLVYLDEANVPYSRYLGWDINPDLIEAARQHLNARQRQCQFDVVNLAALEAPEVTADVAIMLGLLNLNLHPKMNNYDYSKNLMKKGFATARKLFIIDFLSSELTSQYPREDVVFYHDPTEMLRYALELTPNVVLKHDYAPIPQKEFMLFLYK